MSDIRQELLAAFAVEHREHTTAIRIALELWRAGRAPDLKAAFRAAHSLKGAARAVDMPRVEEIAHQMEALFDLLTRRGSPPSPDEIAAIDLATDAVEAEAAHVDGAPSPLTADAIAALRWQLAGQGAAITVSAQSRPAAGAPESPPPATPPAPVAAQPLPDYLRVSAERVENASRALHDLSRGLEGTDEIDALDSIGAAVADLRRLVEPSTGRASAARPADIARGLAALQRDLVALSRRRRAAAVTVQQAADRLRGSIERMALASVETVFGGLPATVRELARAAGREVEVSVAGLEIEIDRRTLQALKDPINHLVRNAVSHGGETPAERRAAGKPPAMSVAIAFAVRGDRLVITVSDDGRGPDLARIEENAVRRGLLPPRRDGRPPPVDQLMETVFADGFSTAGAVDRLSGRGVGLAVVAAVARKLRGAASLRPRRPYGAEALIAVPLSSARQAVVLVEAGGATYGLAAAAIERLARPPRADIEKVEGRPMLRLRREGGDQLVPFVPLAALAGAAGAAIAIDGGVVKAAVLRRAGRLLAVAVDDFRDAGVRLVDRDLCSRHRSQPCCRNGVYRVGSAGSGPQRRRPFRALARHGPPRRAASPG